MAERTLLTSTVKILSKIEIICKLYYFFFSAAVSWKIHNFLCCGKMQILKKFATSDYNKNLCRGWLRGESCFQLELNQLLELKDKSCRGRQSQNLIAFVL